MFDTLTDELLDLTVSERAGNALPANAVPICIVLCISLCSSSSRPDEY